MCLSDVNLPDKPGAYIMTWPKSNKLIYWHYSSIIVRELNQMISLFTYFTRHCTPKEEYPLDIPLAGIPERNPVLFSEGDVLGHPVMKMMIAVTAWMGWIISNPFKQLRLSSSSFSLGSFLDPGFAGIPLDLFLLRGNWIEKVFRHTSATEGMKRFSVTLP